MDCKLKERVLSLCSEYDGKDPEYCAHSWAPMYKADIDQVQRAQNKASRTLGSRYSCPLKRGCEMWPHADSEEERAVWEISKHLSKPPIRSLLIQQQGLLPVVINGGKENNRSQLKQQRFQFFLFYKRMKT